MDSTIQLDEAFTFAASAPFIVMLLGFIKGYFEDQLPPKAIPPIAIALAFVWGTVLSLSGYYDANMAEFIYTGLSVGFTAIGLRAAFRTYEQDPSDVRKVETIKEQAREKVITEIASSPHEEPIAPFTKRL